MMCISPVMRRSDGSSDIAASASSHREMISSGGKSGSGCVSVPRTR